MPRALVWSLALNVLFACAAAAWLARRIVLGRASWPSLQSQRADHLRELSLRPVHARAVMVGDSLTQYGEWSELLGQPVVNRGVLGDTIDDVRARLADVAALTPDVVFLLIGINDLERGTAAAQVARNEGQLIGELRRSLPSARLVVQSILPVRNRPASVARSIALCNAELARIAPGEGAIWVDLTAALSDSTGALAERNSGDGVHLSGAGYRAWAKAIEPLLP